MKNLIAAELGRSRGRSAAMLGVGDWHEDTELGENGIGLDSLERLEASGALNEFFHLHEQGAEDHLLTLPRLGDWCDLVAQSLASGSSHMTFRTSGSTGVAKRCTHSIADLLAETEGWLDILGPVQRIVSLVPSHHIYGTLFTTMLPDRLGVEVIAAQNSAAMLSRCRPGTLVVATPTLWRHVTRVCPVLPAGMTGISSTAPMPPGLAGQLIGQGLERLIEIYGSSETGGIAYRTGSADPFVLLDCWSRAGDDEIARGGADGPVVRRLMDRASWLDARCFRLDGRRDGAVQVGGVNVFPELIRDTLLGHDGIAEAAVRLDRTSGRLKAFIVPAPGQREGLADGVDRWCEGRLRDVERPRHFTIGSEIPRTPVGKLADW